MATKTTSNYIGRIYPPEFTGVSQLRGEKVTGLKHILGALLLSFIFGAFIVWLGGFLEWKWLRYTGYIAGPALFFFEVLGEHVIWVTSCPCCGGKLGRGTETFLSPKDNKKKFSCEHCFEWLISDAGKIRAFTSADITDEKEFETACIKAGIWPEECIVCGTAPTRRVNARSIKLNPGMLLVGSLSVSSAKVSNIPYCAEHEDAVDVKTADNKVRLLFNDYSALRRYLYANRIRPAKSA